MSTMNKTSIDFLRREAMESFSTACTTGEPAESRLEPLRRAMLSTPHGPSSNTLEHGIDTWRRYGRLCDDIACGSRSGSWPDWLQECGALLLSMQQDRETMRRYLTFHDCGKPWSMTRDAEGKLHFPEHAQTSARIWREAGGSEAECDLMLKDMMLHTIGADEAKSFALNEHAPSLLLAAFSELQSNADSIFGGLESTSYKIKIKALNRRAKAICSSLKSRKAEDPFFSEFSAEMHRYVPHNT